MWTRGGIKGCVDEHLLAARSDLPPRLKGAFDRLLAERGLGARDEAPYFGVLGHPLFELPLWVAERLRVDGAPPPDADLSRVLGVSALGYLHARAHDDWLDGDCGDGSAAVALAHALLARCTGLLVPVVGGSPAFWLRYSEVMDAYAEALAATEEARRAQQPVTPAVFALLLGQSQPLALPSLALLDRAGRWDLASDIEEFVHWASAASQVYDDLTDYHHDRDAGHPTWVSSSLDRAGGDAAWTALPAGATGPGGAVRDRMADALTFHDRAAAAARTAGLAAAEPWLAARGASLEALPGILSERLVTAFARGLATAAAGQPGGTGRRLTDRKEP